MKERKYRKINNVKMEERGCYLAVCELWGPDSMSLAHGEPGTWMLETFCGLGNGARSTRPPRGRKV